MAQKQKYVVRVVYWGDDSAVNTEEQQGFFGPFTDIGAAEATVVYLAQRHDTLSATIEFARDYARLQTKSQDSTKE